MIWAIGASMVILAGLIHLPRPAIAGFGLLLVLGHNLLDGIPPAAFGALAPLWHLLHVPGELGLRSLRYPLVPWVGVMALGYVAGPAVFSQDPLVSRRLAWVGGFLVFAFVELRLGPGLVALSLFRHAKGQLAGVLVTFGPVPFLFYVAHLYLVHSIAVAAGLVQGFPASAMLTYFRDLPKDYGFGLPVVYLVWLAVVAALYPLCRRYAELKARRREWWMSYL